MCKTIWFWLCPSPSLVLSCMVEVDANAFVQTQVCVYGVDFGVFCDAIW